MSSNRTTDRIWMLFAVSSLAMLAVLAVSPVKDYFREYRPYQVEYRKMMMDVAGSARELREAENATVGIRQIWVAELGNQVDRCTSCHLGVEDQKMAGADMPFRVHSAVPHADEFQRFGCVSCHRGQGRATTVAAAHGEVQDWSTPILPLRYVEASCGICHEGLEVPEASMLSQGRKLIERSGCPACHEMNGFDKWKRALRLDGLAEKTSRAWLRKWLASPVEVSETARMPDFELSPDQIDALVAYLWAQPELTKPAIQTIGEGEYSRGKKLFRESRCITCHTVDGRGNGSAPELGTIGSKVQPLWLINFIADPHAYQPDTVMPMYDFTAEDLSDIVTYLTEEFSVSSVEEEDQSPRSSVKLVEEGRSLYQKYGCGGCHRIGDQTAPKIGPSLKGIGTKDVGLLDFGQRMDIPRSLPAWLRGKVAAPRSFREGLKMPQFNFDAGRQDAVVTALLSLTDEDMPASYRVPQARHDYDPPGRFGELVDRYRCMSCHLIQGTGGDISTAPLTAEASKVKTEWLKQYLLLPTTIRPLLTDRMIPLGMSEEEAAFIADFISNGFVEDDVPVEIFPDGVPAERAERGRSLFREQYGCRACHQVAGVGGYYGPPLDDSPKKLHSGWIAWWLEGPQRWRSDVRCPDFGMPSTDAEDLSAYLMSLGSGSSRPPEEAR